MHPLALVQKETEGSLKRTYPLLLAVPICPKTEKKKKKRSSARLCPHRLLKTKLRHFSPQKKPLKKGETPTGNILRTCSCRRCSCTSTCSSSAQPPGKDRRTRTWISYLCIANGSLFSIESLPLTGAEGRERRGSVRLELELRVLVPRPFVLVLGFGRHRCDQASFHPMLIDAMRRCRECQIFSGFFLRFATWDEVIDGKAGKLRLGSLCCK